MVEPTPKEVDYGEYCPKCIHWPEEVGETCDECLEQFWNYGTDRPINYREKSK